MSCLWAAQQPWLPFSEDIHKKTFEQWRAVGNSAISEWPACRRRGSLDFCDESLDICQEAQYSISIDRKPVVSHIFPLNSAEIHVHCVLWIGKCRDLPISSGGLTLQPLLERKSPPWITALSRQPSPPGCCASTLNLLSWGPWAHRNWDMVSTAGSLTPDISFPCLVLPMLVCAPLSHLEITEIWILKL